MDEMGATEPEEMGVFQGELDLRGQLVPKERKEIREILEFRAPPVKKDNKGRKVILELQHHLSLSRTSTGKNAPGNTQMAKTKD